MLKQSIIEKIKSEHQGSLANDIPILLDSAFTGGNNQKFMKMYDWMSKGYDIAENIIGTIKYGSAIKKMRTELMSQLEWKANASVLYVSIGTGNDLQYIPKNENTTSLNVVGVDISMGMLKKCQKKYKNKMDISLIQCCAESLPFKDNSFDIVFHVGGINFFNNKAVAIEEMIRVAKPGTKILIADETSDYIDSQYKKSSLSKKYFKEQNFDFNEILSAIPSQAKAIKTNILWKNKFYCITFNN
jgi:ubiquinone/menaquinone biosynthesis C-methylase UbiE